MQDDLIEITRLEQQAKAYNRKDLKCFQNSCF